jgi:hypothetical protein
MLIRMNQKGEGRLGCVVGLLILVAALFVAYKLIPVKMQATDMREAVQNASRSASGKGNDTIRKEVMTRAKELGIALSDKDVVVTRRADFVRVEVKYDVTVDFPGYKWNKHYEFDAENPVF